MDAMKSDKTFLLDKMHFLEKEYSLIFKNLKSLKNGFVLFNEVFLILKLSSKMMKNHDSTFNLNF